MHDNVLCNLINADNRLFPVFPDLGLDIQDDLGRHEVGFVENTEKLPINEGNGCRFKCEFKINKVGGKFNI